MIYRIELAARIYADMLIGCDDEPNPHILKASATESLRRADAFLAATGGEATRSLADKHFQELEDTMLRDALAKHEVLESLIDAARASASDWASRCKQAVKHRDQAMAKAAELTEQFNEQLSQKRELLEMRDEAIAERDQARADRDADLERDLLRTNGFAATINGLNSQLAAAKAGAEAAERDASNDWAVMFDGMKVRAEKAERERDELQHTLESVQRADDMNAMSVNEAVAAEREAICQRFDSWSDYQGDQIKKSIRARGTAKVESVAVCPDCDGSGVWDPLTKCRRCNGTGKVGGGA